jgi:AAA ATPase domain
MRYIYVDNFRGFSDTLIPIKDVNFLVGENSTGKSSILALINLLSSPHFWFNFDFNTDSFRFGGFQNIISAESSNKKSFRIGMLSYFKNAKKKASNYNIVLFTFINKEGQPSLNRFVQIKNSVSAKVVNFPTTIQYKFQDINKPSSEKEALNLFQLIQVNDKTDKRGFKKVSSEHLQVLKQIPLIHSISIINTFSKGDDLEKDTMSFAIPAFSPELAWLAPIRTKPKRTYDGFSTSYKPEGDHTPYMIRKVLSSASDADEFRKALSKFGNASGLFKEVKATPFSTAPSSPFEIRVILSKQPLNLNDVGYGVSQILPVIVEILAKTHHECFSIQQPEIHLHPRAQAAFGDLIFQVAIQEDKRFLVETHSDFILDRFRLNYRKSKKKKESQVLFFERASRGNIITSISIDKNGEYCEKQPSTFRDFFIREEMRLLGL